MHAGRIACCSPVTRGEFANGTDRLTDGCQTVTLRFPLHVANVTTVIQFFKTDFQSFHATSSTIIRHTLRGSRSDWATLVTWLINMHDIPTWRVVDIVVINFCCPAFRVTVTHYWWRHELSVWWRHGKLWCRFQKLAAAVKKREALFDVLYRPVEHEGRQFARSLTTRLLIVKVTSALSCHWSHGR